jgi:hypothetical protein
MFMAIAMHADRSLDSFFITEATQGPCQLPIIHVANAQQSYAAFSVVAEGTVSFILQ